MRTDGVAMSALDRIAISETDRVTVPRKQQ